MSQTSILFGVLFLFFLITIVVRGKLQDHLAIIFGP